MRNTYIVTVDGEERLRFSADLSQAAEPLMIIGEDGEKLPTPYCTGDARHNQDMAAELLNNWLWSEGGEAWGESEDWASMAPSEVLELVPEHLRTIAARKEEK